MDDSAFDLSDGGSDFGAVTKSKPKVSKAAVKPKKTTMTKPKATTTKSKVTAVPKKRSKAEAEEESEDSESAKYGIFEDESLLNDPTPKMKKARTANPVKSPHQKPLAELVNETMALDSTTESSKVPTKNKRASEQYQRLTQLEHIIRRPDTYIGSTERTEKQMWVFNTDTKAMDFREVSFVPGLFKIFDEVIVNASDNKQNDKTMNEIRVTIDKEAGEVSVWNNGRGIPIEVHSKEKIYIPEMIFGHLLTGSNYDDNEQKVTGGRNGYGAKLCNIFSTSFTVETADSKQNKKYKQTWTENMSKMGKAKITDGKGEDYTKVTFRPDFAKFAGMSGIDDDLEALFTRRVYDLAGTVKGVKVKLNGTMIMARDFKKYIALYTKAIKQERGDEAVKDTTEIITESPDPRWEIGFTVSDGSFQQVSFVNSIATTSGGTHVNYIADQITNKLAEVVKKKNKGGPILKANQIRNHIFIFVNALIVNPAFSSQTKEQLTTKASQFGSKCVISDDFMKKIAKTDVIANILHFAEQKADQILKKSDGSKRSRMHNPKLTDANKAGTRDGWRCTLILTEGDSAKGMAMAGRSVAGPDWFGVFPLRGKLLNVRDASIDQISKNQEIQNIKNFLGLQHKKEYADAKGLRYGHLMVMTDQDHDGSHIKGLLINFLQVQFPSLLKIAGFLVEFITPIVKVYKGDPKHPRQARAFYTIPEYLTWKEGHQDEKGWEHKYYKGLGTSSTEESQEYFNDIDKHHKEFETMKEEEVALIDLAFSKKKADERKEWLRQFKVGTFLDHTSKTISYTNFVNKELILFSMADNIRSIPSVIDGLKPGQRKVLYTCFKKNIKKDIKVVELAGLVSGLTQYQHGDVSLQQTIVGLAQTFVGSNNINTLEPSGNFGTRLQGGSDAASARYIYTRLSPFARKLFNQADEPLLTSNMEDGKPIEPEVYVPVVPLVLINGADGIGTGWSTSIPNYSPEDIVENLKRKMDGDDFKPMQPWFRGFKGTVAEAGTDRWKFSGIIKQTGDTEIEISELPIRVWTQDFKEKLEEIIKAEKIPSFIKDYKDYNTHKDVNFIVQLEEKHAKATIEEGLEDKFKLSKTLATSNLVAFDPEGRIHKYASVEDIMLEFYNYRLKYYQLRKEWMLEDMRRELRRYTNQARFVKMIIDAKLTISRKKKAILIAELKKLGFDGFSKATDAAKAGETENYAGEREEELEDDNVPDASSFDYLLGMPLWSLTQERVDKLQRQIGDKELEIDALLQLSTKDLWRKDLDEFLAEWRFQLEDEHNRERAIRKGRRASKKFALGLPTSKKRKGEDDDEDYAQTTKPKKPTLPKAVKINRQQTLDLKPIQTSNAESRQAAANKYVDGSVDESDIPASRSASAKPEAHQRVKAESDTEIRQSKPARNAAKKVSKYVESEESDSDNGDDLLANLGDMVKGLPGRSKPSQTQSLSNFSAAQTRDAEPVNPPALGRTDSVKSRTVTADNEEMDSSDEKPPKAVKKTNGPMRAKNATRKPSHLSDGEDLDVVDPRDKAFDLSDDEPVTKPVKKVNGATKKSAPKTKPANAAPAKKANQSPAAKAYAKRLAKKIEDSDDDIDDMADDILDSPDELASSKPKPAARPGRRAAAATKKSKYVFDDDDDDHDEDMDNDTSEALESEVELSDIE